MSSATDSKRIDVIIFSNYHLLSPSAQIKASVYSTQEIYYVPNLPEFRISGKPTRKREINNK
jgi:hypothetical protein